MTEHVGLKPQNQRANQHANVDIDGWITKLYIYIWNTNVMVRQELHVKDREWLWRNKMKVNDVITGDG